MFVSVCVWSCSVCLRPSSFSCGVCGLDSVQLVWTPRPVCAAPQRPYGRSGSSALTALAGLFLQPPARCVNPITVLTFPLSEPVIPCLRLIEWNVFFCKLSCDSNSPVFVNSSGSSRLLWPPFTANLLASPVYSALAPTCETCLSVAAMIDFLPLY